MNQRPQAERAKSHARPFSPQLHWCIAPCALHQADATWIGPGFRIDIQFVNNSTQGPSLLWPTWLHVAGASTKHPPRTTPKPSEGPCVLQRISLRLSDTGKRREGGPRRGEGGLQQFSQKREMATKRAPKARIRVSTPELAAVLRGVRFQPPRGPGRPNTLRTTCFFPRFS